MKSRLVFLVGNLEYFCTHRLPLALAAQKKGFEVHVLASIPETMTEDMGRAKISPLPFEPIYFHRGSLNPLKDLPTLWRLYKLYRRLKPHIVHHVAMKPVLYGTCVARWLKVPLIVNALGGMGYLFTETPENEDQKWTIKKTIATAVLSLFRFLWRSPSCHLIVQNNEDYSLVSPLIATERLHLIRGAGVDIDQFTPSTIEKPLSPVVVTMVARLLLDKGVGELVEAARFLKQQGLSVVIQIAGDPDKNNPRCVPDSMLKQWQEEGLVRFLGKRHEIAALYKESHIAVLPSYREGLPKSLLEAAACGLPIVTTQAIGCRDVVDHEKTGLLVPVGDSQALANALEILIRSPEKRVQWGMAGRQKIEETFSSSQIIEETLGIYILK